MVCKDFSDVVARVKSSDRAKVGAIVCAADEHTLQAVFSVMDDGLIKAIFLGNREAIKAIAAELGREIADDVIIDAETPEEAAKIGCDLVNAGKADFLMKGKLETSQILRAVVNKETGLGLGGVMSHISFQKIPSYHKMLITTDGGMLPYPTLEQKKAIIENAVATLLSLGYECPKVGVLACTERVNPKMPETVDAAALKEMNERGEIKNCIVEGPIALDLALVAERSVEKNYSSPVSGDCDILVVPNIHAGNILGKSLVEMAGAKMSGLILGAKCPIVVSSRGSTAEEKYYSLVLASAACGK